MSLRTYVHLWFFITAIMSYEYLALGHQRSLSILFYLQRHGVPFVQNLNFSTDAGRPISLVLGWSGIVIMLLTNLYVFRKRFGALRKLGWLPGWLNFHIFCGLLGPTCIVFHSDFKVRGLVAISFWSMIVVAVSGVIGRYLYTQIARQRKESGMEADRWARKLEKLRGAAKAPITDAAMDKIKKRALRFVGVPDGPVDRLSLAEVFFGSLLGDFRLFFVNPPGVPGLPPVSRDLLAQFALARRDVAYLEPFRQMLGYWHAFHIPFSFIMYIAAAVHIVSALMFGTIAT